MSEIYSRIRHFECKEKISTITCTSHDTFDEFNLSVHENKKKGEVKSYLYKKLKLNWHSLEDVNKNSSSKDKLLLMLSRKYK